VVTTCFSTCNIGGRRGTAPSPPGDDGEDDPDGELGEYLEWSLKSSGVNGISELGGSADAWFILKSSSARRYVGIAE